MSSRTKGRAAENQFKKILDGWGYKAIEQARPTIKHVGPGRFFSSQNDFFGLFDLIGKRKTDTIYVQVKHGNCNIGAVRPKIRQFMIDHGGPTDAFVVAEKVPRKGFILHYIEFDKYNKLTIDMKGMPMHHEEVKE